MELITIIVMVTILSIVWGGFVFFLRLAIKNEKLKKENG